MYIDGIKFLRSIAFFTILILKSSCLYSADNIPTAEKPIVVVIPSYNNIKWHEPNLRTVLSQKYSNFRVIYINDCSRDGTGEAVQSYLLNNSVEHRVINFDDGQINDIPKTTKYFSDLVNEEKTFFILVNNVNRCGALENLYRAIYSCLDEEIIVTYDGDDWFYHDNVFKQLNDVYSSREVWLTHGSFYQHPHGEYSPLNKPIPEHIVRSNSFRNADHPTHLRTFYSWLFKMIKTEDLLWNGKFFQVTWDLGMMFPMCEMAQERHAFISEYNYVYNTVNPISDWKVNGGQQGFLNNTIRNKPRYSRIERDSIKSE